MAPGTEHGPPGPGGFQQPPMPPPQPAPSCEPGPLPVPGVGPNAMTSSAPMPPQGVQTTLESIGFEIHQLKEQIKQSELNLSAQRQVKDIYFLEIFVILNTHNSCSNSFKSIYECMIIFVQKIYLLYKDGFITGKYTIASQTH